MQNRNGIYYFHNVSSIRANWIYEHSRAHLFNNRHDFGDLVFCFKAGHWHHFHVYLTLSQNCFIIPYIFLRYPHIYFFSLSFFHYFSRIVDRRPFCFKCILLNLPSFWNLSITKLFLSPFLWCFHFSAFLLVLFSSSVSKSFVLFFLVRLSVHDCEPYNRTFHTFYLSFPKFQIQFFTDYPFHIIKYFLSRNYPLCNLSIISPYTS